MSCFVISSIWRPIGSHPFVISRLSFSLHRFHSTMRTVIVEGNIGSGKTSLINYFKQNHSKQILSILEPVSLWRDCHGHNMFNLMSKDPHKYAFPFQQYVQLTMSELHRMPLPPNNTVKLMERSLYSARHCFVENHHQNGVINDAEYAVYEEYFKFFTKDNLAPVDIILYLKASPEVCLQRIKDRNRNEETTIPLEYLQQLDRLHDEWLNSLTNSKGPRVVQIDANQSKEELKTVFEELTPLVLGSKTFQDPTKKEGSQISRWTLVHNSYDENLVVN